MRARLESVGERSFVVAIDGRSGAGKSTLAGVVAELLEDCLVIDGDDFYAGGAQEEWDQRTPAEKVAQVIDWSRQQAVLRTLRAGERAEWFGYDWDAFDGRLRLDPTVLEPARVVILEGAYSARPELADLVDLRVLVEADLTVRRQRLRARDGADWHDAWFTRWDEAERYYFGRVVTRNGFDAVLRT
ncbi:AAA family ATPase [Kineosporia sp. NBRC 101677]|uniref:uridine kinase family protein n=1 Tax=Kineosporia sp. NBRC 101677 TaxID=3032197 RepID=UPI002553B722|nr:AAA family ATPase [Kineosporia sp. NBRC 101677]